MATGPRFAVKFRRRREGKTNYKARLALLKSEEIRLVIRITNTQVICQFIKYSEKGDKTIAEVHSSNLRKLGWTHSLRNLPAAYLTGYLLGKTAKVKKAILDVGLQSKKRSRLFAAMKGVLDAGVEIPHDSKILPPEERIRGAHINLEKEFESVKKKINEKK